MPKTIFDKYSKSAPAVPAPAAPTADRLNDLFGRYKKARKISDKQIGEALNTSAGYVALKRHKGTDHWRVADVRQMCAVLHITDPKELGEAILGIR